MTIKDKNASLSKPETVKTRTDFTQKPVFGGLNLSPDERKLFTFVDQNKADVSVYLQCKTTKFLIEWLKGSIDYYKDVICAPSDKPINIDGTRGLIAGQREILAMFEALDRAKNINQEAKK